MIPRRKKYKKALLPKKALWKKKISRKKRFLTYRRRFTQVFLRGLKVLGSLILLAVVVYGAYYLFVKATFFKVSKIEVSGATSFVNATDLKNIAKEYIQGGSIFLVKTKDLSERLREQFQGAKSIEVNKKLPDKVSLTVVERVPLALIFNDSNEDYFLVDEEGYVLGIVDKEKTNLPEIKYEGEVKVGYFIDKNLVPAYLEMTAALSTETVKTSSMSFYPNYIQIFTADDVEVLIGAGKNKKEALRFVIDLTKRMLNEGKEVKKVDLRYDKVIVSY